MATNNGLEPASSFGRGLNSLRVRFTIMVAIFCSMTAAVVYASLTGSADNVVHALNARDIAGLAFLVFCAATITFLMTGKLTKPIENLKATTEAIARGDYETVVSVDCNCEVGGLADSFRMMVERLNANVAKINSLAYEDGVTGLPNRAMLDEVLKNVSVFSGYLLFVDMDQFKQVNDVHGHQVGDELLRKAANRMKSEGLHMTADGFSSCLPALLSDTNSDDCRLIFRFAGDEFVVLLAGSYTDEAVASIAQKIIDAFERPFALDDCVIHVGASVGIATIGKETQDAIELIKHADIAMYEAKKRGRGQFVFFDEELHRHVLNRIQLEEDFVRALKTGELEVHYQPKRSVHDLQIVGLEALVRWRHPERGLLFPDSFLSIAEEAGLMSKVGREVMTIAARDINDWRKSGKPYRVAINVCPSQFADEAFAENLIGFVSSLGMSATDFELEITETIAMSDIEKARSHLVALKNAGFFIAIDDFGTGFSNLSQLAKLPYDCLKMDRSLVEEVATSHDARTIVASIISMAHGLGHVVVAEGVEDARQLEILKSFGCDLVQGYFTGRPAPYEQLFSQPSDLARLAG